MVALLGGRSGGNDRTSAPGTDNSHGSLVARIKPILDSDVVLNHSAANYAQ